MYVAPLAEVKVTIGGSYGGLRRHKGLDLVAASGTPVRAIVGGQYHSHGYSDAHGNWGIWEGDDGNFWNACHLLRPFDVRGRIHEGQIVALSGATGNVSGPHLHQGVSTRASLTLGTFDPAPIVLTAPQPKKELTMLVLSRTTTTTAAQEMWVTGASQVPQLIGLTTNQAAVDDDTILRNWITNPIPPLSPAQHARVVFWLNATALASGSGGGLTPAQDAKLMAIPSADGDTIDEGELGAAETNSVTLTLAGVQTKLDAAVTAVNAHTDAKFDSLTLSTP